MEKLYPLPQYTANFWDLSWNMGVRVSQVESSKCFRRLEKLILSCALLTQVFHPWWCETCRVIQQIFLMKDCRVLKTPSYIFSGSRLPTHRTVASRPLGQVGPWPDLKYAKSGQVGPDRLVRSGRVHILDMCLWNREIEMGFIRLLFTTIHKTISEFTDILCLSSPTIMN